MGGKHCQSLVHPEVRRFRCNSGKAKHEVILLVASKGKCFVLDDRAARGEAVVFVALSGRLGAWCGNKERRMICEGFVAVVIINRAMNIVGAGLEDNVGRAPSVAAAFGSRGGLY